MAQSIPYEDDNFDVVHASSVIEHVLDVEKSFQEIFRVLKPGGRYVCAEFEKYPIRFFCRKLLEYPRDLIDVVGFDIDAQFAGPSITRCRSIVYRVLMKPGQ